MTKIKITSGGEGPSYDPYHYTELTVKRLGHELTLHTGLACWLKVDGKKAKLTEDQMNEEFERLTGFHPADWYKFYERLEARRYANNPYYGCDPYFGGD